MKKQDSMTSRLMVVVALVVVGALASALMPATAVPSPYLKKNVYNKNEGIYASFKDAEQQLTGIGPMGGAALNPNQLDTVGTLNLPAGKYAIFAKGWVDSHGGSPQHVHCALVAGGDIDHTRTQTGEFDASVSLQVVHSFGSAGSVTLECADDGGAGNNDAQIQWVKITAIRANALTNGASS
jgi:hypothetical protein